MSSAGAQRSGEMHHFKDVLQGIAGPASTVATAPNTPSDVVSPETNPDVDLPRTEAPNDEVFTAPARDPHQPVVGDACPALQDVLVDMGGDALKKAAQPVRVGESAAETLSATRGHMKHIGKKAVSSDDEAELPAVPVAASAAVPVDAMKASDVPCIAMGRDEASPSSAETIPHTSIATSKSRNDRVSLIEPSALQAKGTQQTAGMGGVVDTAHVAQQDAGGDWDEVPSDARAPLSDNLLHAHGSAIENPVIPAATFQPFLLRSDRHPEVITMADEVASPEIVETSSSPATVEPIKRLDLQWNDASLGKIALTAEMRDGALHAVVTSSHATSTVSARELHQFLEDSLVPVYGVQVHGAGGSSTEVRTLHASTPQAGMNLGGGMQSFSESGQKRGGSFASNASRFEERSDDEGDVAPGIARRVVVPQQQQTQRLSIHI